MCMVSLYMLAILCCHTIDWDIFLRYWCLSQIYYYYYYYNSERQTQENYLKVNLFHSALLYLIDMVD